MEGWQTEKLGDICSIQLGATPARKMSRYYDSGKTTDNVWLSIADMPKTIGHELFDSKEYLSDEGANKVKLVKKGTLLFSFKLSIGRICFAGKDLRTNEAIAALDIKDSRHIDKKYLAWFLAAQDWDFITAQDEKLLGRTLNKAKLKEIDVIIPQLSEQKRIVAILDEAFAGIDQAIANTEKNLASAREIFDSYLNGVFTRKGEGWSQGEFAEIGGDIKTGPFGSLLHKSDYINNGTPLINPAHIINSQIIPDTRKTVNSEALARLNNYRLKKGDVIIGRRGEMGRCAAISEVEEGWLCGTGCFIISPKNSNHSEFITLLLSSNFYKEEIAKLAAGAVMLNLSNKSLGRLSVSLPSPKDQLLILKRIDSFTNDKRKLDQLYKQKLTSLNEFKQSLIQKAFSGELTADMAANAEAAE